MESYQKEFIKFAIEKNALRFGKFQLKSGRISPYFFNSGLFNDGESLSELGKFYAAAVEQAKLDFDLIYGPAYKGIPLASALSIALQEHYHVSYPFCFNRKEEKDHGEGGTTFGAEIRGRVLIVDDVISAGTSIDESINIINSKNGNVIGAVIAVDRQEKGRGAKSAIRELEQRHNIKVLSIIGLDKIIDYLSEDDELNDYSDAINAYQAKFGVTDT